MSYYDNWTQEDYDKQREWHEKFKKLEEERKAKGESPKFSDMGAAVAYANRKRGGRHSFPGPR